MDYVSFMDFAFLLTYSDIKSAEWHIFLWI